MADRHLPPAARECLSFRIGQEEYAIDILKVQEIRGYERSTRMVGTSDFVKGVLNLRGVMVPIIDLRMQFGLADVPYDALTVTVILQLQGRVVGIVVDAVSDVVELSADMVKPVPAFSGHVDSTSILGIATVPKGEDEDERMLILLDVEQLMRGPAMGLAEQTLQ
ncbi:chemotaxis protein CheW [Rhodoferax saidenbachensis]|uniref:Chemotaxis protein CheW n=1 Tax=Rhodoferax saidenbachensis TaxID=1484693 RepID=A0A1P8KE55_9BURK|nr:chemotaxis protein CheW [Rhodoferax saidenbachensis]APW44245.1 chemotaxis protein CheW [Rhodoferax saidenbachensis]